MLIEPFKTVGELSFNDTREQIRNKLNEDFISSLRGNEPYDLFQGSGLFVYYDENKVNAFEFFESKPIFNDIDLLKLFYNDLVKMFKALDPDIIIGYNSFTSYKYGIGGNTNDDPEDDNALPEAVIIFRKGYYDDL